MMKEKIIELTEKIKPYINMDGGDIEFIKYEDGYIYVHLIGACADCMYQDETLNESLLSFYQSEIPEIKGVINVTL